jgi:hypothetical protein
MLVEAIQVLLVNIPLLCFMSLKLYLSSSVVPQLICKTCSEACWPRLGVDEVLQLGSRQD